MVDEIAMFLAAAPVVSSIFFSAKIVPSSAQFSAWRVAIWISPPMTEEAISFHSAFIASPNFLPFTIMSVKAFPIPVDMLFAKLWDRFCMAV